MDQILSTALTSHQEHIALGPWVEKEATNAESQAADLVGIASDPAQPLRTRKLAILIVKALTRQPELAESLAGSLRESLLEGLKEEESYVIRNLKAQAVGNLVR